MTFFSFVFSTLVTFDDFDIGACANLIDFSSLAFISYLTWILASLFWVLAYLFKTVDFYSGGFFCSSLSEIGREDFFETAWEEGFLDSGAVCFGVGTF